MKKIKIPTQLEPFIGAIYFLVVLLISHFVWKFTMLGDESDTLVTFFGTDVSAPFNLMSKHIADASYWLMHLFGSAVYLFGEPYNVLQYENGVAVHVVWACTGLKQMFIFLCIMVFSRGPWVHKLWYVSAGILVVYAFNVVRIASITALIENHPEWFNFLHETLFKYLYYGVIFGIWVLWEEKVRKLKTHKKAD